MIEVCRRADEFTAIGSTAEVKDKLKKIKILNLFNSHSNRFVDLTQRESSLRFDASFTVEVAGV